MKPLFLAVLVLAGIVFWRVGSIASRASRARFGCPLRFQAFAIGYAVLALGAAMVLINAWEGAVAPSSLALLAASAMLILFDRRKPSP